MAMQLPSASNSAGSLAGLVSGVVVAKLVSAGIVATIATFIGFPPATVTMLIGIIVTAVVNLAVTHVAEVKDLNGFVAALPKTYPEYPGDKK